MTSCWDIDQCVAWDFPDDRHKFIYFFGYKVPQYYDVVADPPGENDLYDTLGDAEAERSSSRRSWSGRPRRTPPTC